MTRPASVAGAWLVANTLGFWLGWLAGGNDLASRGFEASARNLFYGAAFGTAQAGALALGFRPAAKRLWVWPLLTALAFAGGVRVWKFLRVHTPVLGPVPDCLQLGLVLGMALPVAQLIALRRILPEAFPAAVVPWTLACAAQWLALEYASCAHGYQGWRIPAWAALTALPTALALARIRQSRPASP